MEAINLAPPGVILQKVKGSSTKCDLAKKGRFAVLQEFDEALKGKSQLIFLDTTKC